LLKQVAERLLSVFSENDLFSAADTAMYQAKNVKNSFNIFSSELREQLMETSYIQQALPLALAEGIESAQSLPIARNKTPIVDSLSSKGCLG
jgi:hypothetical protein